MSAAPTSRRRSTSRRGRLTLTFGGGGGGAVAFAPSGAACVAGCTRDFTIDSVVTLTATPDAKSTFTGWEGAGCGGTGTCEVTMWRARAVAATFGQSSLAI